MVRGEPWDQANSLRISLLSFCTAIESALDADPLAGVWSVWSWGRSCFMSRRSTRLCDKNLRTVEKRAVLNVLAAVMRALGGSDGCMYSRAGREARKVNCVDRVRPHMSVVQLAARDGSRLLSPEQCQSRSVSRPSSNRLRSSSSVPATSAAV